MIYENYLKNFEDLLTVHCRKIAEKLGWKNDGRNSKGCILFFLKMELFNYLEVISYFKEIKILKRVVC